MSVRIIVADDHVAIRTGLVTILGSAPDIDVVGESGDGLSAVRMATSLRPDLVLMDIRMPGIDGIEATHRLVNGGICDVLVLTTFDLDDYVDGALAAGAAGFLLKSASAEQLLDAVRAVARGDGMLAPEVTRRLISRLASVSEAPAPELPRLDHLTPREVNVLACLGHGMSNAEISSSLKITEATTKTHVSRVLTKLGVRSRVQAAIAARSAGVIDRGQTP
ncbi:MAG: response regulator transcription factor [Pseudonocardia sp.]|nr:response regulator transcription factor [Pseudonocardia sp.]